MCTSTLDWRDVLERRPPPPDRFRHELKFKHGGHRVELRSNDQFVAIEVRGDFDVDTRFSINRPDWVVMAMSSPRLLKRLKFDKWPLFVNPPTQTPSLLRDVHIRRAIEALELGPDESLHVYRNQLTIYSRPASEERLSDLLDCSVALADRLPAAKKSVRSFADLPTEFQSLVPLIRKWAESDDSERLERLERASNAQMVDLVQRLVPLFPAINRYLDGFGGAPPESAVALGTLAECATEAQFLLQKRRHTAERRGETFHTKPGGASKKQIARSRTKAQAVAEFR